MPGNTVTLDLPETILKWLPKVAEGNVDPKTQKPKPLTATGWILRQFHQVEVAQGNSANLIRSKGYLEWTVGAPGGAESEKKRITADDLNLESYRPDEKHHGNVSVEVSPKNLERLVWVVALLNAMAREKFLPNEPFDTLEGWAEDHITRVASNAFTDLENKELAQEQDIAESLSKAREKRRAELDAAKREDHGSEEPTSGASGN